jgi:ATP-dependent Clp protease ATP-binding subunit ClpA
MTETSFPVWMIHQLLDRGVILAEAMGFPEVSRLAGNRRQGANRLRPNLVRLIGDTALGGLHRRHASGTPEVHSVSIALEPIGSKATWRGALPLRFDAICWNHGEDAAVAFVPALGIHVLAEDADALQAKLPGEIRAALSRGPDPTLANLVWRQRVSATRIERLEVSVGIKTARARAQAAQREQEQTPSILAKVATDLTRLPPEPICRMEGILSQLAEVLTARRPRSVLLVGPSGVGKTAAVRELARQRQEYNLGATPFWATSGARLVAGMTGYGMWQQRCRDVVREASKKKAIVHIGNLIELMQVGRSEHNVLGIASFLRPYLGRGDLLAIAECTPEQMAMAEREDPHLLAVFQPITVAEPDVEAGRAILRHVALLAPIALRRTLPEDTLDTLDRLHRRYTTYSGYPGRPIRFLMNLLQDRRKETHLLPGHVLAAFARETGLPRVLIDPGERLDLAALRDWLGRRVIEQQEAVDLVADLIATTKAALTRPRRPIASLLFIGPTGVGKTEMAKAVAEFLFGSRERLTRFDMSEYNDPLAVQRLVGGFGRDEGLLTARVREQPFGVLLFDEFEKAHPQFFDLLLQVLGEGRLTDAAGRLADFTNTVIILTSNLGAESYQQGRFGFGEAAGGDAARRDAAREHFRAAVESYLRPELVNRIDRLVPFAPLGAAAIERIARRNLQKLEERDGVRHRGVTLRFGDDVAAHLARTGFDVRYGARPLLRAIEREMLAPLADRMNRYSAEQALAVVVDVAGDELSLEVRARVDESGQVIASGTGAVPIVDATRSCIDLRRDVQTLERCRSVREFQNELYRLEREQKLFEDAQTRHALRMARAAGAPEEVRRRIQEAAPKVRLIDQARMSRLAVLRPTAQRLRELAQEAANLEDESLLALYSSSDGETFAPEDLAAAVGPLRQAWHDLLVVFYCRDFTDANHQALAIFGEDRDWLMDLARGYVGLAESLKITTEVLAYRLPVARPTADGAADAAAPPVVQAGGMEPQARWRGDILVTPATARQPAREVLERTRVERVGEFLSAAPPGWLKGLVLEFHGPAAAPRFRPEAGLHMLRSRGEPAALCLVEACPQRAHDYVPPPDVTRRGAIGNQERRRTYDEARELVEDALLNETYSWAVNEPLRAMLAVVIDGYFRHCLQDVLRE